jgi:outer membrane protein OmpA-like peptidoglycan-associated protein
MEKKQGNMSSELLYFSGDFRSSFRTVPEHKLIIGHIEQNTSQIILCGNAIVSNITYSESPSPVVPQSPLKHGDELPFVEFKELDTALSKRRNIFDYTIYSIQISDLQTIDGLSHGILEGKIKGCLIRNESSIPIINHTSNTTNPINESSERVTNFFESDLSYRKGCGSNWIGNSSNLQNNPGCSRISSIGGIANNGCGNIAIPGVLPNGCRNSGCWSVLSYILWIPLLFSLFKYCNSSEDVDKELPKVEDKKRDYWEDKLEGDFGIDSTRIIDENYEIQYKSILLPNVQFFTNSSRILDYSKKELDDLSLYFNENQELKGIIYGYTDAKGSKERNKTLSQTRAETVMNCLIERGVQSNRLSAIGKGESDPRASNKLREGRLMNRRVEITIIKKVKRK